MVIPQVGYKTSRLYWSYRTPLRRCRYVCSIEDAGGYPEFVIKVKEVGLDDVTIRDDSCTGRYLLKTDLRLIILSAAFSSRLN